MRPDVTITLDGKCLTGADTDNAPIVPVFYGGTAYIPLRQAAAVTGMNLTWEIVRNEYDPTDNRYLTAIYLQSPLTTAEKEACRTYLEKIKTMLETYESTALTLMDAKNDGADAWNSILSKLEVQLDAMKAVSVPQIPNLSYSLSERLTLEISTQRTNIQRAYKAMNTQTTDELFSLTNGEPGALATIALEPIPTSAVTDVYAHIDLN